MITKTTSIRGSIVGDDDLVVEGQIEGSVRIEGALTIGKEAQLKADIAAKSVAISGSVEGAVDANESVTIDADSVLIGSVTTQRLTIEEGATIKGRIDMDFDI